MSNAQDFVTSFMKNLAEGVELTPSLQAVFAKILAEQVVVDADTNVVSFKPVFSTLLKVLTFIATPEADRPEAGSSYTQEAIDTAAGIAATETGLTLGGDAPVDPELPTDEPTEEPGDEGETFTLTEDLTALQNAQEALSEKLAGLELEGVEKGQATVADVKAATLQAPANLDAAIKDGDSLNILKAKLLDADEALAAATEKAKDLLPLVEASEQANEALETAQTATLNANAEVIGRVATLNAKDEDLDAKYTAPELVKGAFAEGTVVVSAGGVGLIVINAKGEAVIAEGKEATAGIDGVLSEVTASLKAIKAEAVAQTAANEAAAAISAEAQEGLVDSFNDEKTTFTDAQKAVNDFAGLVTAYTAALADAEESPTALVDAYNNLLAGFKAGDAPESVASTDAELITANTAAIKGADADTTKAAITAELAALTADFDALVGTFDAANTAYDDTDAATETALVEAYQALVGAGVKVDGLELDADVEAAIQTVNVAAIEDAKTATSTAITAELTALTADFDALVGTFDAANTAYDDTDAGTVTALINAYQDLVDAGVVVEGLTLEGDDAAKAAAINTASADVTTAITAQKTALTADFDALVDAYTEALTAADDAPAALVDAYNALLDGFTTTTAPVSVANANAETPAVVEAVTAENAAAIVSASTDVTAAITAQETALTKAFDALVTAYTTALADVDNNPAALVDAYNNLLAGFTAGDAPKSVVEVSADAIIAANAKTQQAIGEEKAALVDALEAAADDLFVEKDAPADLTKVTEVQIAAEDAARKEALAEANANVDLIKAYNAAVDAQKEAADAVETREELVQAVGDAKALEAEVLALEQAVTDAATKLEDAGYVVVPLEGDETATEANDIFLFSNNKGETIDINKFGLEGEDRIFFGDEFKFVELKADESITGRVGDLDELEIFWQAGEDGITLYVEGDAGAGFDRGDAALDEITTINLVGVDSVALENGFLA